MYKVRPIPLRSTQAINRSIDLYFKHVQLGRTGSRTTLRLQPRLPEIFNIFSSQNRLLLQMRVQAYRVVRAA